MASAERGVEEPAFGVDASWTYEVPFQHAWKAAKAVETRLDLENASAFLERASSSICRVRIGLGSPEDGRGVEHVRAWQLYASCPFCAEGNDQLLRSDHWVDVHEWNEDEEVDLQNHGKPRSGSYLGLKVMHEFGIANVLNWQFFSHALRAWGLRACQQSDPVEARGGVLVPQRDYAEEPPTNHGNIYGISLPEVLAALNEDSDRGPDLDKEASCEFAQQTIAREFGIEGYFGGLYRCAHCGNVFATVFRDSHDATREGRYKIMPEISEAIDQLIAQETVVEEEESEGQEDPSRKSVSTMSVSVSQGSHHIRLEANIGGERHELVFDTGQGSFLLDGESYVSERRSMSHLSIIGFHDNPLIHDCLSALPGLMLKVLEALPSLPPDVDISCSRLGKWMSGTNLLIAANRFIGYPAAFYDEMALTGKVGVSSLGLEDTYPFDSGLPRHYSEVEDLYGRAGLPEDERLKQVLMERPQALLDIMRRPEMPFQSVDVLVRFYQLPQLAFCMRMLCFHPRSIVGWRRLVDVKGEETVFAYIEEQAMLPHTSSNQPELMRFFDVSCMFDMLADSITDGQLSSLRMDSLHEDLEKLMDSQGGDYDGEK